MNATLHIIVGYVLDWQGIKNPLPHDFINHCEITELSVSVTAVADPGSKEKGGPGVLGACPQDFLSNFSQFKGL